MSLITDPHVPVLSDFLSSVPPALSVALVSLAPCISAVKYSLQVCSWSISWYRSWLALALWWALCLLLDSRVLPLLLCLSVVLIYRQKSNLSPVTEHSLRAVVADLTIIQSLLPSLPPISIAFPTLVRVLVILYVPYLIVSLFVSFRVICAIAGSLLLTWRAPWATVLRATLRHSAWCRWALYKLWSRLSGTPIPPRTVALQLSPNSFTPVHSVRFLFTIYENQRWWMGLDWTAALLPGERPSWSSSSQQPLSPPSSFVLPENTVVYLPDGKGGTLKRTASWKWEEPEWRVLVHRDGGVSRVERPLPSVKDDSPHSSRLLKAAGRLRESGNGNSSAATDNKSTTYDADHASHDSKEVDDEELLTDVDGWVYGDNKWEGQSNRGGISKYTRFRRWTRIAVVFEGVELDAEFGEVGIPKENFHDQSRESSSPVEVMLNNPPNSPLRQRLKMALDKEAQKS